MITPGQRADVADSRGRQRYGSPMGGDFTVKAAAGSLRTAVRADTTLPHRWTDQGVAIELQFTGAHLLHLATAGCVLNDTYREAAQLGIEVFGVLVVADGDFDTETWQSTGISYQIEIDSPASKDELEKLIAVVDEVAEIPKALRSGAPVERASN